MRQLFGHDLSKNKRTTNISWKLRSGHTHLNRLLCNPLPRKVRDNFVMLMKQELAPFCIPEEHPQVPAHCQTLSLVSLTGEASNRGMV